MAISKNFETIQINKTNISEPTTIWINILLNTDAALTLTVIPADSVPVTTVFNSSDAPTGWQSIYISSELILSGPSGLKDKKFLAAFVIGLTVYLWELITLSIL